MALSGYRIMWLVVMFDLPVGTRKQRRRATRFRQYLLDRGFEMAQFSIYMRFCAGREQAEAHVRDIAKNVPPDGSVQILTITDRQFGNIVAFKGPERTETPVRKPDQLTLF